MHGETYASNAESLSADIFTEAVKARRAQSIEPAPSSGCTKNLGTKYDTASLYAGLTTLRTADAVAGRRQMEDQHWIAGQSDQKQLVRFLANPANRSDADYSKILKDSNADVLLIGDWHPSIATKHDYIDSLPELKNAGIQAVGFELLPVGKQQQVDEFASLLSNPYSSEKAVATARKAIVDLFKAGWSGGDPKNAPKMAEELTKMVEKTVKAGLKVICLEPPLERTDNKQERADTWLQAINQQVKCGVKMAVFAGGDHFGYGKEETFGGLLAGSGIKSVTVMKTGGDIARLGAMDPPHIPSAPEQYSQAATAAGAGSERFAYRFDPRHPRKADYVIHLPNK
ncbi:MAG TPA: hypothetical protein V6C69_02350 [Trichormus sp.]